MQELPSTLESYEELLWQRLRRGALDPKDAFHILTFITTNHMGANPRSVILRSCLPQERILRFHTDIRAQKVNESQNNPAVAVHAWHPKLRMQIRLHGMARVFTEDKIYQSEWEKLNPASRLNYSSQLEPGLSIENPRLGWESYGSFEEAERGNYESWKKNFAVIQVEISKMEALILSRGQHLRASFEWKNGEESSSWLVP
ncbi:MAG: pyridoxamine 5'-phosphate oxidase family protein [Bacteroidia bacterium]|nr:pyridoxamine 5'-phosphate oxidase family protein [Bacteroidia bacterium]